MNTITEQTVSMGANKNDKLQTDLARDAASGDKHAQQQVNETAQPVIEFQTNRFCKRFCRENQFLYRCSLSKPIGSAAPDAPMCEWGNASYGWMLDDLCKPERLLKFDGRNQASLYNYLYTIANSIPFYERWKDWRFGRKQQVPQYIRDLGDRAAAVFYALRLGQPLAMIAQSVSLSLAQTETLASQIILQLTQRHKLYLLDPPQEVSLTAGADSEAEVQSHQQDIPVSDESAEEQQQHGLLRQAWTKLDTIEQFVLEAMIIEEQDAEDVLAALKTLDISIKQGISADRTNHQQLYYFKRKALAKLGILLEEY